MTQSDFDLRDFTPYLLAMAAESASAEFETFYKSRFGMLRTEWRVVFHLGRYGVMTAKEISARARIHKTKVSRAVSALEAKRFLRRERMEGDRRQEHLHLTKAGQSAFRDLTEAAQRFDAGMTADFTETERLVLRDCLRKIADL